MPERVGGDARGRRPRKPRNRPPRPSKPPFRISYGPGPKPPDPLAGIFGPYEKWINQQLAQQKAQAQLDAGHEQAKWQAYAQWYAQNMPKQIQGIYSNAANQQVGFAKGFSDGMQIAQNQTAGEANKIMGLAGAPEGQRLNPGTGAADALYGTGGFIPGSTLSTQGAAFASAAGIQSGALAAYGPQKAAEILAASNKALAELRGQKADLLSKKAEARLKLKEARAKAKADALEAKLKAKKDAEMMAYRWAGLDQRTKLALLSDRRSAQRIFQAEKRLKLSAQNQTFNQWYKQKNLSLSAERNALSAERVAQGWERLKGDSAGGGTTAKPKWTPLQRQRFTSAASAWAKYVLEGGTDEDGNVVPPPSFLQALRDLPSEDFPPQFGINALVKRYPKMKKTIIATARGLGLVPKAGAAKSGRRNASYSTGSAPTRGGNLIGTPYAGTHTLGNWESDNAIDVSIPIGTPVYAVADGVIGPSFGPLSSTESRFAGLRLHLVTRGNEFYYAHLSRFAPGLAPGTRVRKGQLLGYSGSANGVAHLHFGMNSGDPRTFYGSGKKV